MPPAPSSRARPVLAAGVAVLGLAMLAGALVAAQSDQSRLPENTTIDGIDVGGLETDVARSALERHVRQHLDEPVEITTPDRPGFAVSVSPRFLRARPQIDQAIEEAIASDSFTHRALTSVGLAGHNDVALRYELSETRAERIVAQVQNRLGKRPVPATVKVVGKRLRVVPGKEGVGMDEAELLEQLRTLPEAISLQVERQPPQVDTAEAEQARITAQALLDRPPTVVARGARLRLTAARLRPALRFRAVAPRLEVLLAPDVLGEPLREVFGSLERESRDARIEPNGDRVTIVPEQRGVSLAVARAARDIVANPGGTVKLRLRAGVPDVTARELRKLNITARVATFSTPYDCCLPRVTNIQRGAELLDGTLVSPGGTLSLNEILGQRTTDRGFVAAPQIAAGKYEDAVGGGVSQLSTTLYNAAFFAGLQIVTHQPHEFYISRYPMGREATLSWGGPEMIVRNDWAAGLYVNAVATDSSVTVNLYSAPLGRRVETSTGEPTNRVEPETEETVDDTLKPGERIVDQQMGGSGFTIAYTRQVFQGSKLKRDERYTWRYRPVNALVRVGPEPDTKPTPGRGGRTAPDATGTTTDGAAPPSTTTDAQEATPPAARVTTAPAQTKPATGGTGGTATTKEAPPGSTTTAGDGGVPAG
ncbi:MAG: VanW family protein [Thermoleophilia bacterium]|nr:VanW family protein [Thermoleophilia bacterium]